MRLLPLLTLFSTSAAVSALALPQQPIPQYSFPPDNPDEQTTPEEVPPEQDVSTPPEAPPPTNPSGPNFLQSLTLLGIGSAMTLGAGKAREVMRKMADNKAEEEDLMQMVSTSSRVRYAECFRASVGEHFEYQASKGYPLVIELSDRETFGRVCEADDARAWDIILARRKKLRERQKQEQKKQKVSTKGRSASSPSPSGSDDDAPDSNPVGRTIREVGSHLKNNIVPRIGGSIRQGVKRTFSRIR